MPKRKPRQHKAEIAKQLGSPPVQNMRSFILETADKAVNGSRDVAYGAPENNFGRIKDLWNTYLEIRPAGAEARVNEADVAIMNILLKVGRLAGNQSHIDSWVDIAGYAACGAEVVGKP